VTAAEKILKKALVASNLDSREWNSIQAGLRDRAFFSSRVAEANILDALQNRTAIYSDGHTSMSEIRKIARQDLQAMGYKPKAGEEGTIKDLYSKARLDVIVKHNVATARGFIRWAEGNEPGAYAAFPAQEFKRVHPRKHERGATFWTNKWKNAGGRFFAGGRMIALKDDPVWTNLSIFGTPYPPFEWGSGMGVRDIDRKTAIELGLATDAGIRERVRKLEERRDRGDLPSMNGNLSAKIPYTGNTTIYRDLKRDFGDLVKIDGDEIVWRQDWTKDFLENVGKNGFKFNAGTPTQTTHDVIARDCGEDFAKRIIDQPLVMNDSWLNDEDDKHDREDGHGRKHFGIFEEKLDTNVPMDSMDLELLPTTWRYPVRSMISPGDPGSVVMEIDTFDGCVMELFLDVKRSHPARLKTFYKRKTSYIIEETQKMKTG